MVFKKIIFQNRYIALETPSRPPPLMANAILNFHFDFLNPSLTGPASLLHSWHLVMLKSVFTWWGFLKEGEVFGDIWKVVSHPYWCYPCLLTHFQHVLVVAVTKGFKACRRVSSTILGWVVFNVDSFADFKRILFIIARLAVHSISHRVKRMT